MTGKIALDLIIGAGNDGPKWHIDNIPDQLWRAFVERAKAAMPEKGDRAWAAFLCEAIASIVDGTTRTFIMTDIPAEAEQAHRDVCNQAGTTPDRLFASALLAAQEQRYHLVVFNVPPGDTHQLTIANIPAAAWDGWTKIAAQAGKTPQQFFGVVLEAAYHGDLTLDTDRSEKP